MYSRSITPPAARAATSFGVRRVVEALLLSLRVVCDEGGVHRVLMVVMVRERGMDLGRRQVGILLDDLRCTVAMSHVISDDVDHPMAGAVDAWDSAGCSE
jgi:hypothetical protein